VQISKTLRVQHDASLPQMYVELLAGEKALLWDSDSGVGISFDPDL
jgi:hypothetical protein